MHGIKVKFYDNDYINICRNMKLITLRVIKFMSCKNDFFVLVLNKLCFE